MADDLDLDSMFIGRLRNGTMATPQRAAVPVAVPAPTGGEMDLDQMFLTRLRPEVAKPQKRQAAPLPAEAVVSDRPRVVITQPSKPPVPAEPGSGLPDVGAPSIAESMVAPSDWNLAHSLAYGMSQGWSPEIVAKTHSLFTGSDYETELKKIKDARAAYQKENSGKDLLGTLVGSTATAIPALMAGQAYAAAPLAAAATRAVPALAPIANFLGGTASGYAAIPSMVARGAVEGTAGAALQSHMGEESVGDQLKTGAMVGGVAGPVLNMLAKPFQSKINSTVANTVQDYTGMGGEISVGKLPGGSSAASVLESVLGKGRTHEQQAKFNELLTKQTGVQGAKAIDQDFIALADAQNGNIMNSIRNSNSIPAGHPKLLQGFADLRQKALTDIGDPDAIKAVNSFIDKLEHPTLTGDMTGDMYQQFTRQGDKPGLLTKMAKSSNPEVADFARNHLRPMLDDVWSDVIGPGDKMAWDAAKKQYRATRVIDSVIDPATGEFDAKKLLKAVERSYGNVNNAGELGTLAKAGQYLGHTQKGPSMGHAARSAVYAGSAAVGAGAAHQITEHGGHLLSAALANPAGATIPLTLAAGALPIAKGLDVYLNSGRNLHNTMMRSLTGRNGTPINPLGPAVQYLAQPRE